MDDSQPWAEAVAIKDGQFLLVGTNADVAAHITDGTTRIDLEGRLVLPGLINLHAHPLGAAEGWANLRINNPANVDLMLEEIQQFAQANPDLPAIRGEPWYLDVFPGNSPRKELLDNIVPDRPVYIGSQTGHSAWVNSKALELAGITKDTPQTEKFIFDIDPETGEPTGTVREFAMGALERVLERSTPERYAPALAAIADEFNKGGFTSVVPAEGASTPEEADGLIASWEDYRTDRVYPRYVKIFYDGGPDSFTASLLDDYEGRPDFKGSSNLPKAEMIEVMTQFNAQGIGIVSHVLGDGGGRDLVEVYAAVRAANGVNDAILHFSHAWMTLPEDLQQLAQVPGVCVDFSPALNYPSDAIIGSMVPPIGEARYHQFFNVRAAFESGVAVGFGDDWPSALIPDPNAFHQMQSWVTRRDPENPDRGTLNGDQAVSLEQVVRGFTVGGAQCLGFGWEDRVGSIEAGKLADFIVLDRNIFDEPIETLYQTQVDLTVVGGDVVYEI